MKSDHWEQLDLAPDEAAASTLACEPDANWENDVVLQPTFRERSCWLDRFATLPHSSAEHAGAIRRPVVMKQHLSEEYLSSE
jgi:hypothetical protein